MKVNDGREYEVWSGALSATRGNPEIWDRWVPCSVIEAKGAYYYIGTVDTSPLWVPADHVRVKGTE